jgi:hypothetical protein
MSTIVESLRDEARERSTRSAPREKREWVELPIFIHGISPDSDPGSGEEEYLQLLGLVNEKMKDYPGKTFSDERIFVTWGVPTKQSRAKGTDQYLAEVERKIQAKVKEAMGPAYTNPFGLTGHVRDLLFFGMSDLTYYISADGERDLRNHVFTYISKKIQQMDRKNGDYFSLTIFGHSAGSVIAHDLLFHLFTSRARKNEQDADYCEEIEALRTMVDEGRLRVRRLYTFGSPISLLVLRASSLVNKVRADELFKPRAIGFKNDDLLGAPRWVNFWTRHDLISYPVSFLYDNEDALIEDHHISSPISPISAHTAYWTSEEMAGYIAKTF